MDGPLIDCASTGESRFGKECERSDVASDEKVGRGAGGGR